MWTITFNQDTEVEGVGTLYAFTEYVKHSRRVDTLDSKYVDAFVVEAKSLETEKVSKKSNEDTIISNITALINK
jgi:hypothetical protein